MGQAQSMGAAQERLGGPRQDPAKNKAAAGSRSSKLTLLLNHDHEPKWDRGSGDVAPRRAPGFILDVIHKGKASCTPTVQGSPLHPPAPAERWHRRIGYDSSG